MTCNVNKPTKKVTMYLLYIYIHLSIPLLTQMNVACSALSSKWLDRESHGDASHRALETARPIGFPPASHGENGEKRRMPWECMSMISFTALQMVTLNTHTLPLLWEYILMTVPSSNPLFNFTWLILHHGPSVRAQEAVHHICWHADSHLCETWNKGLKKCWKSGMSHEL